MVAIAQRCRRWRRFHNAQGTGEGHVRRIHPTHSTGTARVSYLHPIMPGRGAQGGRGCPQRQGAARYRIDDGAGPSAHVDGRFTFERIGDVGLAARGSRCVRGLRLC